jgi:hypothetical protein
MAEWQTAQVAALAPDPGSLKAGQELAAPRRWTNLGQGDGAVWGECQGSGKSPYQTQVDLGEPAFRCSCPSRKFPCKHGLGLMLLFAGHPDAIPPGEPPGWAREWLDSRRKRQEARAERQAPRDAGGPPADPAAQARRASQREDRVAAGAHYLDTWLKDLARGGLSAAAHLSRNSWQAAAARMVDCQAPGLARLVRELGDVPASGEGWQERMLLRMGRLHLLLQAYRRLDDLSPGLQAEVRSLIGWTVSQDELAAGGTVVTDRWWVLGQAIEEEGRLTTRRTWLRGSATGRWALLLAFAAGGLQLEPGLPSGTMVDADLVFYPGELPLRALIRDRRGVDPEAALPAGTGVRDGLDAYSAALAANPWTPRWPVLLGSVTPRSRGAEWRLVDPEGAALPLRAPASYGWKLLGLGGGEPLSVFGEWDGERLAPLHVWPA